MGRLIGLELHNFKSYKGTTTIGFGSSFFTSIIGPNGAGKSNMMDAISFVLGIQSSQLRSNNLKDLIYRGRKEDSPEETFDASFDDSDAPTRAHVIAVYEKDDKLILNLKRTISVNGTSEYHINDRTVTALNYSLVLKAENILIKARNFLVFQGDVEQIASQSSQELTKLVENISRSNELIPEYNELKLDAEKAYADTQLVINKKRSLNSESRQYKDQRDEQIEFEHKLMEKSDKIKQINLYKLYHNEQKHFLLKNEVLEQRNHLKVIKSGLLKQEQVYKQSQTEFAQKSLEVKKHQIRTKEVTSQIDDLNRQLLPIEASKRAKSAKIASLKLKVQVISQDIVRQKQSVNSVERKLRDAQKLYDEFQVKSASSITSISQEGQIEYEKLRLEYLANEGAELEEKLSLLINEKESIQSNINHLQNQKANAQNRIDELELILNSDLNPKLKELSVELTDTLAMRLEKTDARAKLVKRKDEHNYKELQLNSQLRDVLVKLDELASQQRESDRQIRLRENVSTLKKLLPKGSIKGLVNDLVRPSQKKYDLALLTILGMNFDSIIVESSAIAYRCIERLKEMRLGTATFIPLDSIQIDPVNLNYLRSLDPGAQPGIDIVEYDDKTIEQAVQYVVGDALVVDNIELARKLKWNSSNRLQSKIVTVDGSVIHKSGLMTGGLQQQKYGAISNWDKNEVNKLTGVKEKLNDDLSKLLESKPKELEITVLSDEITQIDDKIPILRNQKINLERVIEDRKSEIAFQNDLIVKYNESIEEKNVAKSEVEARMNDIQEKISVLQDSVYADFCERHSFTNGIEDYENLHGSSLRERTREKMSFSRSIAVLSNKLTFENERLVDIEERKSSLESLLKKAEAEVLTVMSEKQELASKIDQLQAEHEVLVSEEEQYAKQLQSKLKHSKSLESSFKEAESEMADISKKIIDIEEQLLSVDTDRVSYLRNCKIERTNVPLKDGLLDEIPIAGDFDSLVKEIYKIEIDYSDLDERSKEEFNLKTEARYDVELQDIISELEKLTPNVKAVEKLNEIEGKIKVYENELSTVRQRDRKAVEKFNKVKAKRYSMFMEAFKHISEKIDSIYKELTTSPTSPIGGSAYLDLEDIEEPYNSGIKYHAMPPLKRFRDMELLSGGEKTMAALALLFAIHSYQPSPFFVLDEVDAALDNANVARIANYIKKSAGPNFQFIVISLKNSLYEKSDALVGIYREQQANSSRTVTLDLRNYPEEEVPDTTVVAS